MGDKNTNNNLTLLVKLGIDNSNTTDLQTQIDALATKLKGLQIKINISNDAVKALEKLSGMDFSNIANGAKKATEETGKLAQKTAKEVEKAFEDAARALGITFSKNMKKGFSTVSEIKKELNGLNANVRVNYDVKDGVKNYNKMAATIEKEGITTSVNFERVRVAGINKDSFVWMPKTFEDTDKQLQNTAKSVNLFLNQLEKLKKQGLITNKQFKQLTQSFNNMGGKSISDSGLKKLNEQLDFTVNKNKNIKKQITEQETEQKKIIANENARKKLITEIETAMKKSQIDKGIGSNILNQMKQLDTSSKNFANTMDRIRNRVGELKLNFIENADTKALQQLEKQMQNLMNQGKITKQQFQELHQQIATIGRDKITVGNVSGMREQLDNMKQVTQEQKKQIQDQTKINSNELKRKSLILDVEKALKSQSRTLNEMDARKLLTTLNQLNPASKKFAEQLAIANLELKRMKTNATEATRQNIGMMEAFKTAMEKFPIWMAASTIFFGIVRTAREFGSILIDIDSKLVSISKVLSEDVDIEEVFNRATQSAETFGQSISQALDAYIEFSRQGFKGEELGILSDAGLVAANVGEITAQKASEYMTASLVQWKMDAKDAMNIIDSWNEISNNYATTTEKLAQGQARAGATARAMGLDFDQLNAIIGTVTASTKQSGNEVGNFVKSVLPRLISQPAQDALASLDISLTDGSGNMRDVIEVYTEVANKVKDISDTQRIAVTEGLAGKFHISRMQALLDDLGQADSMYRSMYDSSVNSSGSAMRENEKYMQSLEARINLARVEVEKLAIAFGEAFLQEGMIQGLKVFSSILNSLTNLTNVVGALPIVLGTVSVALALLSTRFSTLITAIGTKTIATIKDRAATEQATITYGRYTIAANASAVAARRLTISSTTAQAAILKQKIAMDAATASAAKQAAATRVLSTVMRTLGTALVAGAGFFVFGLAIEGILKLTQKSRELKEAAETANKELYDSYQNNRDSIDDLLIRYRELEEAVDSKSYSIETLNQYYDVQNQIGQLLPSLVTGEDEHNRKLIESYEIIKTKVDMLKEQMEVEKEIAEWQAKQDRNERIEGNVELGEDNLKAYEKGFDDLISKIAWINTTSDGLFNNFDLIDVSELKNLDDVRNLLSEISDLRKEAVQNGNDDAITYYDELTEKIIEAQGEINGYSLSYNESMSALKFDYISKLNDTLKNNTDLTKELSENSVESIGNLASELMKLSRIEDVTSLNDALSTLFINLDAENEINDVVSSFEKLNGATAENFTAISKTVEDSISAFEESLANSGLSDDEISVVMGVLSEKLNMTVSEFADLEGEMRSNNITFAEAKAVTAEYADSVVETNDEITKQVEKLKELSSAQEQIVGVSEAQVSAIEDSIFVLNTLSGVIERTETQEQNLVNSIALLTALYPQLATSLNGASISRERAIKIIEAENNANKALLKAYELSADGKLTAEAMTTMEQLEQTNKRIEIINKEILALDALQQKYAQVISELSSNSSAYSNGDLLRQERFSRNVYEQQQLQLADLASLSDTQTDYAHSLQGVVDTIEEQSKSTEKANKETKEATYLTDKHKQALEELNYEIEKQISLQNSEPENSEKYRKSLEKQIQLEKEKLGIQKQQVAELENQIKSGKIIEKGSVVTKTSNSSSTSQLNLSGWSGGLTSGYGYRIHPVTGKRSMHGGVDLGGKRGTRLDANVSGKVIASGSARSQGYSETYGNIVVVQDESGFKHLYAHLDRAIAKLGDTIVAGTHIGNIGATGRVTGSHLHYEVRNTSGKTIDPSSYVNSAKKGIVSSSNSSSSSIETTSTEVANTQKAIDDAKSDLVGLQSDMLSTEDRISDLELKVINSQLSDFNVNRERYQRTLDYEDEKIKTLDLTSSRYGATLDYINKRQEQIQKQNQNELNYINDLIKGGNLTARTLAEMQVRAEELKNEMLALANSMKEVNATKLEIERTRFDEYTDDLDYALARSESISSLMDEGSADYNTELEYQIRLLKEKQAASESYRISLQKELSSETVTQKYSTEVIKAKKEELEDLSLNYWELENAIVSLNKSLEESTKKLAEDTANALIDSYKDYISQKRDMHLDSLDDEMDAEDRRHKKIIDNYQDELEAYRKLVQEKLDLIDDEEDERDYTKEMDELEGDRLKIIDKLNLLSLDDSYEAKAERKKLQEELAEIEETISEKRHDREVSLRKDNLNDLLEQKEEQIKKEEEIENERHENEKQRIDDLKEYWSQFYEDQLNDERKFAEIKEQIVAGNFDALSAEFKGYLEEMELSMPEIENTLNGTMEAVGTSIRENIIDNIKEALSLLSQVQNNSQSGSSSYAGSSGSGNSSVGKSTLSTGDAKVLAAKYILENIATTEKDQKLREEIKKRGYKLAEEGRSSGSTIPSTVSLSEHLATMSKSDRGQLSSYLLNNVVSMFSDSNRQDSIRAFAKRIASLSTGGYTGKFQGGKIGLLHEEEVILNKNETKSFFKYAPILETLHRLISPLKMPNITQPQLSTTTSSPSISLEFNIDKMVANESTAKDLAKTVLTEVTKNLKLDRGIR